jgi:manganese transport protein
LPLAMFPLLWFTGSPKLMGSHRNGRFLTIAGWTSCLLITALDIYGLPGAIHDAMAVFAPR